MSCTNNSIQVKNLVCKYQKSFINKNNVCIHLTVWLTVQLTQKIGLLYKVDSTIFCEKVSTSKSEFCEYKYENTRIFLQQELRVETSYRVCNVKVGMEALSLSLSHSLHRGVRVCAVHVALCGTTSMSLIGPMRRLLHSSFARASHVVLVLVLVLHFTTRTHSQYPILFVITQSCGSWYVYAEIPVWCSSKGEKKVFVIFYLYFNALILCIVIIFYFYCIFNKKWINWNKNFFFFFHNARMLKISHASACPKLKKAQPFCQQLTGLWALRNENTTQASL